ncbi:MAG: hypothetical protein F4Z16_01955 [Rhodothermaceae bacterium]|nr:hypothetical protein [Rhodothermaceae bacterium]MYJ08225.1 hypothetical protein [Rhodothermaceae bacterium]
MTNSIKYWSMRAVVMIVLAFLAYTGGSLLEQATATVEVEYCENDRCNRSWIFTGFGWCSDSPHSNTGCEAQDLSCRTYSCNVGGDDGDVGCEKDCPGGPQ